MKLKKLETHVAAVLIFAMWGAFAWTGKTPVAEYVQGITALLSGVGVHGIHQAVAHWKNNTKSGND